MNDSVCLFTMEKNTKATYEVTKKCNYKCEHCCNSSDNKVDEPLDTSDVKHVIDNLVDGGIEAIYLSGGEPFYRNDIKDIVNYIAGKKDIKKINIASNGSLIDNDTADWLSKIYNLGTILISIDGHNAETHEKLRKAKGSFYQALNAIKQLRKKDINVRFGTVLWKDNIDYMDEMIEIAHETNASEIFFNWLIPVGRTNEDISVPRKRYVQTLNEITALRKKHESNIGVNVHRFKEIYNEFSDCPGGEGILHVLNNGTISPCSWIAKLDETFTTKESLKVKTLEYLLKSEEILKFLDMKKTRFDKFGPGCPAMCMSEKGTCYTFDPLKYPEGTYFEE